MALPVNGSTHLIPALLLIYRPRKDERLSWPSWLICSGWFTPLVVTPQLQVERRTLKVRQSETDVLPLCHATNFDYSTHKKVLASTFGASCLVQFVGMASCMGREIKGEEIIHVYIHQFRRYQVPGTNVSGGSSLFESIL